MECAGESITSMSMVVSVSDLRPHHPALSRMIQMVLRCPRCLRAAPRIDVDKIYFLYRKL